MSKLIIRLTIVLVAVYLLLCYIIAAVFGVDVWCQAYYLLFILCVCLCISKQGVYHCKYIKWTAYAILIEETLTATDTMFDWVPINLIALIQPTFMTAGITTTTVLAVRHYIKVKRLKKIWHV